MAGLIPQPFIDELLQQTDIVDLIDGYVPLKKQGTSFVARCPFHSEKTPSFNVVPSKQFYHCFGCGVSGNAVSFVMEHLNQGFVDAIETLATRAGMEVPRSEEEKSRLQHSQSHYELLEKVCHYYQKQLRSQGQQAIEYLKSRGLSGEIARLYQLGFAKPGWNNLGDAFKQDKKALIATGMLIERDDGNSYDRYRNRIMFPIHDKRGRIIGFGGRIINPEDNPKYLNSPETTLFQKNRELYGLFQILQQAKEIDYIIIVEGYMDVIALAQLGIGNAVATLGTATSTTHIQRLAKHSKRIIFCFDGDNAGVQAANRAMEICFGQLSKGLEIKFAFLPDKHDPDSYVRAYGKQAFLEAMQDASPLPQYFFKRMLQGVDLTSMAGKSLLATKIKPYLEQIPEETYKQLFINELSRLLRLSSENVSQLLNTEQASTITKPTGVQKITRSMPSNMRLAIALLIQTPQAYTEIESKLDLKLLTQSDTQLLNQLIDKIKSNPRIKTGNLIEFWRNTNYFLALSKLAAWEHHVPTEGLADELLGALKHIEKQVVEKKINTLLNKANAHGLNDEERNQLQKMIQQRAKAGENM